MMYIDKQWYSTTNQTDNHVCVITGMRELLCLYLELFNIGSINYRLSLQVMMQLTVIVCGAEIVESI